MDNYDMVNNTKDIKELKDIVEKILKIDRQLENKIRKDMIETILEAKAVAPIEIRVIEKHQGYNYPMPWENFTEDDLCQKLKQCKQGLYNHAINKFGEKKLKELLKKYTEK